LQSLGSNLPATVILILITLFAPLLGSFTSLNKPDYPASRVQSHTLGGFDYGSTLNVTSNQEPMSYLPDKDISDVEINVLS
jgi:hypothetical protein